MLFFACPLQAINRTLLKWLKLWDKVVFGKGQDKEKKGRPEQIKKPKPNFAKNYKKQGKGVREEEDWKVSLFFLSSVDMVTRQEKEQNK